MNLQYVDVKEAYLIHQLIITRVGSKAGVRDFTLLHFAVERPKATYTGKDLYPTIFLKAAALMQSLCLNHPFTNGNKRASWATTHRFLEKNNYHLKADKQEAVEFMLRIDNEKPPIEQISSWLRHHSSKT